MIQATQGSKWFTVIDLKEGFYHIEIEEDDKHKTAFEFEGTVYEWNSMVMGFKNSPQILQRVMNRVLEGLRGNGVEVYMDDIVVQAEMAYEHERLVKEVFGRLSRYKMRVNLEKMQFREQSEYKRGGADAVGDKEERGAGVPCTDKEVQAVHKGLRETHRQPDRGAEEGRKGVRMDGRDEQRRRY